ncbi:MAG TPA: magnesium transporter [Chloroflexota bacterium]|nr:magnesium transporter [Chloroflexota bacterium]
MTPHDVRTADLAALRALPAEDLAETLYRLDSAELATLFAHVGDEALADLLAELDVHDAARLITKLSRAQAADVLEEMDPDDAVDVVAELPPATAEAVLFEMEPTDAEDVRALMAYPEDSAGRLMTPDVVALAPDLTADEALYRLRTLAEQAETIYYSYVTDPATQRLLGVLSLHRLVLSRADTPIRELMIADPIKIRADASQVEAARLLDQHHLLAIPVVDAADRLVGMVTADDAAEVLLEEAGEDIERLGGSQPLDEPYLRASITHLFRKRIVWLLLLFVAEAYTGSVLRFFEETLSEQIALAFFIPLLIGTGGNTGSQTVTLLVGALRVGEVAFHDLARVLRREIVVGLLLGGVMGAATYVRAWTLGVGLEVGPVVAVTAACIVLWAAAVAAVLPLVLHRLRLDPAVISAPLITTLVDGTGLVIYFSLARWMLGLS